MTNSAESRILDLLGQLCHVLSKHLQDIDYGADEAVIAIMLQVAKMKAEMQQAASVAP